jgi:bacteriorhodopsin
MILIADYWEKFSLWASTQPTFLQVAIGVALFYVVLLIIRAIFKFAFFIISGLFSGRPRFGRRRTVKPQRQTKPITIDDDVPPFIFR